jgi:hypothetical protein
LAEELAGGAAKQAGEKAVEGVATRVGASALGLTVAAVSAFLVAFFSFESSTSTAADESHYHHVQVAPPTPPTPMILPPPPNTPTRGPMIDPKPLGTPDSIGDTPSPYEADLPGHPAPHEGMRDELPTQTLEVAGKKYHPNNREWHHVFPQAFKDFWKWVGLNPHIASRGRWLPAGVHHRVHNKGYNDVWAARIMVWEIVYELTGQKPTAREVLDYGRKKDRQFETDQYKRPKHDFRRGQKRRR